MNIGKRFATLFLLMVFLTVNGNFLFSQNAKKLITPCIDSIFRNTLDYLEIKNSLVRQQFDILQKEKQIGKTLSVLNRHNTEIVSEKQIIEGELKAINRHIDSLIPPRPVERRPKANILDIINEGLTFSGNFGLNINQLALSNWAAGGESSSTGKAFANLTLTNNKKRHESKFIGSFAFGISRFSDKRVEKADDKIDLSYSYSRRSGKLINFSLVSTFNTQFADGYTYPNDSVRISSFFAPAYLTVSAGYTFKTKKDVFQAYVSPLAGKVTFVMAQELADQGKYGVKPGYYDADSTYIHGENIAPALGANIIINFKHDIGKNISYATLLNCFYNYSEKRDDGRVKIDVNWENTINFVINKSISAVLFVHLKYDHNTTFPVYETIEGVETVVDNVPKLQFKESLGIALVHKF